MKRLVAFILLLVMVFSRTEVSQFVKIPMLVQHYMEHLKTDSDMSFAGFLCMHYHQHSKDANAGEHHDLPFKSHQCNHFSQIDLLYFHSPALGQLIEQDRGSAPAYREDFYYSDLLCSIWQPPQA